MTKLIFVCHGNICRSAMAEFIMKQAVKDQGREKEFQISSAAVSYEEEGNDLYPPAQSCLRKHQIHFTEHRAHRITPVEFAQADLVIVMDQSNLRLLERIVGSIAIQESDLHCGLKGKVHKMMEFGSTGQDVADPWYTGNFEITYRDLQQGCTHLLELL